MFVFIRIMLVTTICLQRYIILYEHRDANNDKYVVISFKIFILFRYLLYLCPQIAKSYQKQWKK